MKELINNEIKSGLIVIASRPNLGKTKYILEIAKHNIENGKKVLFFSLENNKESILKRMNIEDNKNLIIKDDVIKDLNILNQEIVDVDMLLVDYLQLLPNIDEAINILKNISIERNIPVIVTSQLNRTNDKLDLSDINLEKIISFNPNMISLIERANTFIVLFNNNENQVVEKKLKDN